jgi:lysozyme family protein
MAEALPLILKIKRLEGGISCDPDDRATLDASDASIRCHTNQGIRYSTYVQWAKSRSQSYSEREFLNMTSATWQRIFFDLFWLPMAAHKIPASHQQLAEQLVDFGWGSGPVTAARYLQTLLNARFGARLAVDGNIGPSTLAAISKAPPAQLNDALYGVRVSFLKGLAQRDPSQNKFLTGWLRRAADVAGK